MKEATAGISRGLFAARRTMRPLLVKLEAGKLTWAQYVLVAFVFLLAAWPAWVRGGTPVFTQNPLPFLALGALVCAWIAPGGERPVWLNGFRTALRDPFLYLALAFLALLAVQWWNAGRVMFFHPVDRIWTYTTPVHAGWPSAFSRPEAEEMLRWFFPAACAALAVRSGVLRGAGVCALWRALSGGSAVLAAVGLAQQAANARWLPYTRALDIRFFASFGYENHAASFFVLAAALSAALLVRNVFCGAESGRRRTVHLVQDSTALILNVTAAQMSLSRAGIVLGWLFIALGATWIVTRVWPTLAPAGRVKLLAGVLAFALSLGMLVLGFGRDRLRGELDSLREASSSADARRTALSVNVRYELVRSALDIWTGNPWFGVGGWGFRYLLPYAQPVDDWQWTTGYGKSNVHNDSVQFLVEFGTVGAGLMTAAVAVLIAPVLRRTTRGRRVFQDDPAVFFAWMGGGLVLLHSLIDLPFRSPAILLLFILAWAGAGVLAKDCVQSTTSDRCLAPERTAR